MEPFFSGSRPPIMTWMPRNGHDSLCFNGIRLRCCPGLYWDVTDFLKSFGYLGPSLGWGSLVVDKDVLNAMTPLGTVVGWSGISREV